MASHCLSAVPLCGPSRTLNCKTAVVFWPLVIVVADSQQHTYWPGVMASSGAKPPARNFFVGTTFKGGNFAAALILIGHPQSVSCDPHRLEERWPFPFQTPAPMPAFPYRTAVFCSELFWIVATLAGPLPGLHRTDYRSEGRFPLLTDDSWHLQTVVRGCP